MYGAVLSDDFNPIYTRIDSLKDMHRLQGSKYVQCDTKDSFEKVKYDLLAKRQVLYSGTSCVINGLYNYLIFKHINTEKLITCDIICHGVASPALWMEHVELQESRFGKLERINFRDKHFGWRACKETYTTKAGKEYSERTWNDLYFTNVMMRPCCYKCFYLDVNDKPADITMGDYFGEIREDYLTVFDASTGISFAVVHSSKGEDLLRKSNLYIIKTSLDEVTTGNLQRHIIPPSWNEKFWNYYKKSGYENSLKKYTVYGGIVFKIKRKILKSLGKW